MLSVPLFRKTILEKMLSYNSRMIVVSKSFIKINIADYPVLGILFENNNGVLLGMKNMRQN